MQAKQTKIPYIIADKEMVHEISDINILHLMIGVEDDALNPPARARGTGQRFRKQRLYVDVNYLFLTL